MPHGEHTRCTLGGKDSANRENNKIKTNFFYFFFRDAAYLIKIKQINVKPPNFSPFFTSRPKTFSFPL